MKFNVDKCKVMHFGKNNPNTTYFMNNNILPVTTEEPDLGIIMDNSLKPTKQCLAAYKKANGVLGRLLKSFHFRDRNVFLRLYKTFVRCHLEYATPAWSPWNKGDIDRLEKVQERAVRQVRGLKGKNYEDKLKELGMDSLEERRQRFDMIAAFKILESGTNQTFFTTAGANE